MISPTKLEKGNIELSIRHRFLGAVNDETFDTFFGMDRGANINLGLRIPVISNTEMFFKYIRSNSEYNFGISYKLPKPLLNINSQFNLEYFTFEKIGIIERRNNFLYLLALQTDSALKRVTPTLNLLYDGYYETFGTALGLNIRVSKDWSFQTEFSPVLYRQSDLDNRITVGEKDYFSFAVKYQTYAHHFVFLVSNGSQIGSRSIIQGTNSNDLFFGFNIQRKLYF